jgi:hypothetical protein
MTCSIAHMQCNEMQDESMQYAWNLRNFHASSHIVHDKGSRSNKDECGHVKHKGIWLVVFGDENSKSRFSLSPIDIGIPFNRLLARW